MKRFVLALVALGSLALAGCQTAANPTAWGQIATGVGQVIGSTPVDAKVAQASAKLADLCFGLQAAALVATATAPEKQRAAALKASIVVATICAHPPADVAAALVTAADTYAAVKAAGI